MDYLVYIGTFTAEFPYLAGTAVPEASKGIDVFSLDGGGALAYRGTQTGVFSPNFLARHPRLPILYVAERHLSASALEVGALTAFRIDGASGELALLGRARSHGAWPVHVAVHPSGRHAYLANIRGATVNAFPLDSEGRPGECDAVLSFEGSGPDRSQDSPHPHQVVASRDGTLLYVCVPGCDLVVAYPTGEDGSLGSAPVGQVAFPAGQGPRHLVELPGDHLLGVITEVSPARLTLVETDHAGVPVGIAYQCEAGPGAFGGEEMGAEIVALAGGKTVVVSNRGSDTLAVFSVDSVDGGGKRASLVGHWPTRGKTPRNFNVSPDGRFLIAANQDGASLALFAVDGDRLTDTSVTIPTRTPACVEFFPRSAT